MNYNRVSLTIFQYKKALTFWFFKNHSINHIRFESQPFLLFLSFIYFWITNQVDSGTFFFYLLYYSFTLYNSIWSTLHDLMVTHRTCIITLPFKHFRYEPQNLQRLRIHKLLLYYLLIHTNTKPTELQYYQKIES